MRLRLNTTGTSYPQAITVANDIIIEQTDNTYDEVGNLVSAAMSQRLNDANTSTTGSLITSLARVSYMANWFDGIDRSIASANYGAISSFARPSTPPASSATILVTQTSYDDAGRVYQVTDPMGYVTQNSFDNANRTTQTVEASGTSSARTTNRTYSLDNVVATMTAVNATTGNQTTTWTYGTSASSSTVVRNDLLASVAYPDSTGGSDVVSYAYNRLGQHRTIILFELVVLIGSLFILVYGLAWGRLSGGPGFPLIAHPSLTDWFMFVGASLLPLTGSAKFLLDDIRRYRRYRKGLVPAERDSIS